MRVGSISSHSTRNRLARQQVTPPRVAPQIISGCGRQVCPARTKERRRNDTVGETSPSHSLTGSHPAGKWKLKHETWRLSRKSKPPENSGRVSSLSQKLEKLTTLTVSVSKAGALPIVAPWRSTTIPSAAARPLRSGIDFQLLLHLLPAITAVTFGSPRFTAPL